MLFTSFMWTSTLESGVVISPLSFLTITIVFNWQSKRDLEGAEEYYSRAILADPSDGENLSQYAKLVWELYHDHDKALSFYEEAVQATPSDRYIPFSII